MRNQPLIYDIALLCNNTFLSKLIGWDFDLAKTNETRVQGSTWVNLIQFYLLIIDMLKLVGGLGLPIPITKLAYVNFPVQLEFQGFTVPCIVLTSFYTDDEASWLRYTELHRDGLLRLTSVT